VIGLLLSPLTLLLAALALLLAGGRRRWPRRVGIAAACFAIAAMTPLIANGLVAAVERQVPAPGPACAQVDAVVLLSGGLQRAPADADDLGALNPDSAVRAFGLLRAQPPDAPLVIAGGGPYAIAEADVLDRLLQRLGNPPPRWRETASQTTWENAFETRKRLPAEIRRIALATSALHLPRAQLLFDAAGFDVCPLPTSSRYVAPKLPWSLLPQTSGLSKSEAALHELAGMLYYRVRLAWR
jgi:uncharacterized SAM-binding protein YcdF (DUF218 family)